MAGSNVDDSHLYEFLDEKWRDYNGKEPLDAFLERNLPSRVSYTDATWISVAQKLEDDDDEDEDEDEDDEEDDEEKDEEEKEKKKVVELQEDQEHGEEDTLQRLVQEKLELGDEDRPEEHKLEQQEQVQQGDVAPETLSFWLMILNEWKYLLENRKENKALKDILKELALKYNDTSGKWLVFQNSKNIDNVWIKIAKAVVAGKLGNSAKVSTKNPNKKIQVICVYTDDFTDEDDVRRVEKGLRDLGFHGNMSYKADIYTIVGIYVNNNFGLCPTIYKSQAVNVAHASGKGYHGLKWTGENKENRGEHGDWLKYGNEETLDSFLEKNRPSQIKSRDSPWISVSYEHLQQHVDRDMALIKEEWNETQKKREMKLFVTEILKDLAVKYRYTSGKWMIFTDSHEVDDLWFPIAKAVVAGRLGTHAKVSAKKPQEDSQVIYVYTKDFTDERDVRRVERGLRRSGICSRMSYKPDIYTSLGISAKNDLGISPTIFTSKAQKPR